MHATVLAEPELEFANAGHHIDPRFGIANHGPLDAGTPGAPARIRVGIVGWPAAIQGIRDWLGRAREPLAAKPTKYRKQASLFPAFPGFDEDHTFRSLLVIDDRNLRAVPNRAFNALDRANPLKATQRIVDAYMEEIAWLSEGERCDVILCARPETLDSPQPDDGDDRTDDVTVADERDDCARATRPDFHDQLKAAALRDAPPLQIIRPETWDDPTKPQNGVRRRRVQDPATRAWNLHTALYYKAGGAPWRLVRSFADVTTCYLGVSFYRSADGTQLHTSVAQLFNERGEGVVVRGGPAAVLKEDRQPHLGEDDAAQLVTAALDAYRREHANFPARLVVHKTSRFTEPERAGFTRAADDARIDQLEQLWLTDRDPTRLFRTGEHPPLRGTAIALSDNRFVLYTRGSVDFYGTYPGMYIPVPLGIRPVEAQHRLEELAAETLALTKLNWNHSQLDGHLPITLHAANKVKSILRWLGASDVPARRYAHYM